MPRKKKGGAKKKSKGQLKREREQKRKLEEQAKQVAEEKIARLAKEAEDAEIRKEAEKREKLEKNITDGLSEYGVLTQNGFWGTIKSGFFNLENWKQDHALISPEIVEQCQNIFYTLQEVTKEIPITEKKMVEKVIEVEKPVKVTIVKEIEVFVEKPVEVVVQKEIEVRKLIEKPESPTLNEEKELEPIETSEIIAETTTDISNETEETNVTKETEQPLFEIVKEIVEVTEIQMQKFKQLEQTEVVETRMELVQEVVLEEVEEVVDIRTETNIEMVPTETTDLEKEQSIQQMEELIKNTITEHFTNLHKEMELSLNEREAAAKKRA